MSEDSLLSGLLAAVDAAPENVPLRLHVAEVLASVGRRDDALRQCAQALSSAPTDAAALALMQRLVGAPQPPVSEPPATETAASGTAASETAAAEPTASKDSATGSEPGVSEPTFDWPMAEDDVADVPAPAFAIDVPGTVTEDSYQVERPRVRLADVGGMEQVKQRLELAFLGPMRNPRMARQFGKTLGGGLLLYGPPGCGKTFLARAMAGELGAKFLEIGISDVLEMWIGASERNIAELFDAARRNAPCVLFMDEIDALGQKRSHLTRSAAMRSTVNQLLAEMDSMGGRNDGVFVLGATNHPWDLDSALRRPGRFDRMLLVLPPDPPARAAILRYHLRERPLGELDVDRIVRATEHYSGADLAHVCDTAAERALAESMRTNRLHPLTTRELLAAASEIKPSTGPWFATARNVALFANADSSFDELAAYLRKNRKV